MVAGRVAQIALEEWETSWSFGPRGMDLRARAEGGRAEHRYEGERIAVQSASLAPDPAPPEHPAPAAVWWRFARRCGARAMELTVTVQRYRHAFQPGPARLDHRRSCVLRIHLGSESAVFHFAHPAAHHRAAVERHLRELEWMRSQPPRELPGRLPVVFGRGTGGILMHEALGHFLEADLGHIPILWKRIGSQAAHPRLTVADDPRAPGLPACRRWDDEGQPAVRRTLVEDGVLRDLLCDLRGAEKYFLHPGCARTASFVEAPSPRMTNLVVGPVPGGPADPGRLFTRFLWVTGVASARSLPPDRLELEAGPAFVVAGGRAVSGHPRVLVRGREELFLHGLAAIGPRTEACITFGFCTKDGRPLPSGAASPYLAYPEMEVSPL
jgi:hypothetical protein